MLKNAALDAKIGVDTAEKEPRKESKKCMVIAQCCDRAEISAREPYRPANLSGLVLFCIDTSDSESRRIFQHFSTFFNIYKIVTPLHRSYAFFELFCKFSLRLPDFCKILRIFQQIEHFLALHCSLQNCSMRTQASFFASSQQHNCSAVQLARALHDFNPL